MHFLIQISPDGTYKEIYAGLLVNPKEPHLFCSAEEMRKKSIKNITLEKLEKRFSEIRTFFDLHKNDVMRCPFDPTTK